MKCVRGIEEQWLNLFSLIYALASQEVIIRWNYACYSDFQSLFTYTRSGLMFVMTVSINVADQSQKHVDTCGERIIPVVHTALTYRCRRYTCRWDSCLDTLVKAVVCLLVAQSLIHVRT